MPGRLAFAGVIVGMAFLLAACEPTEDRDAPPPVGEALIAAQAAQCAADGGNWGRIPDAAGFVCYRTTRDAFKPCLRESDCDGFCLARSRTCAPTKPFFGCHEVLSSNGTVSTVCVN